MKRVCQENRQALKVESDEVSALPRFTPKPHKKEGSGK